MRTISALLALALLSHCDHRPDPKPDVKRHVAEAVRFTADCATSRLAAWKVRGSAAGNDCGVLLIETPILLEDAIVEAMHYGTGAYDLYRGGVNRFSRDRSFRGVAYRDGSGQTWTYGAVSREEVAGLKPCP